MATAHHGLCGTIPPGPLPGRELYIVSAFQLLQFAGQISEEERQEIVKRCPVPVPAFNSAPHCSSILQDLVPRYPHDVIPLLGQILVAVLIMLAAFGGLMMLTVDFDDQVQRTQQKSTV